MHPTLRSIAKKYGVKRSHRSESAIVGKYGSVTIDDNGDHFILQLKDHDGHGNPPISGSVRTNYAIRRLRLRSVLKGNIVRTGDYTFVSHIETSNRRGAIPTALKLVGAIDPHQTRAKSRAAAENSMAAINSCIDCHKIYCACQVAA